MEMANDLSEKIRIMAKWPKKKLGKETKNKVENEKMKAGRWKSAGIHCVPRREWSRRYYITR